MQKLLEYIKKYRETVDYLFFGMLAVLVNTVFFLGLDHLMHNELIANSVAFFITVQFAYMTNTKFVFKTKFTKRNFLQFWGMRIGTILIDNGGMWVVLAIGIHKLLAKCMVNALIIVLNYVFSKFFIFKKEKE